MKKKKYIKVAREVINLEIKALTKIKKSINEVGFENTAIIYSISNTSSSGGNIGWLKKTQLSKEISEIIEKRG